VIIFESNQKEIGMKRPGKERQLNNNNPVKIQVLKPFGFFYALPGNGDFYFRGKE